jgi:F-type H+-transporting ATPase subunit gamma
VGRRARTSCSVIHRHSHTHTHTPWLLWCDILTLRAELFKHVPVEEAEPKEPKILYLAVSSDGGLCGGIHSSISRAIKREVASSPGRLAIIGDKPKAQLSRSLAKDIGISFSGVGKDVPTFGEASAIADEIMKKGGEWDEVGRVGSWRSALNMCTYTPTII